MRPGRFADQQGAGGEILGRSVGLLVLVVGETAVAVRGAQVGHVAAVGDVCQAAVGGDDRWLVAERTGQVGAIGQGGDRSLGPVVAHRVGLAIGVHDALQVPEVVWVVV